jgi:hypothetical protein
MKFHRLTAELARKSIEGLVALRADNPFEIAFQVVTVSEWLLRVRVGLPAFAQTQ